MKKIRLLTGISALGILGVGGLPLTSCHNDVQQFTVHFETNGGSEIADVKVNKNDKVAKPTDPVWQDHTFLGWYTQPTLTTKYDFDKPVTSNLVLYAGWKTSGSTVSEAEWIAAFDKLTDYDNWNYSYDLLEVSVDDGEAKTTKEQEWKMAPKKMYHAGSDATVYYKIPDSSLANNCYYRIHSNAGWKTQAIGVDLLSYRNVTPSPAYWDIVKTGYSAATYDESLESYKFDYELSLFESLSYVVTFDENKTIKHLIEVVYEDEDNYTYNGITFKDYDTTSITFPFDDSKVDWVKRDLTYQSESQQYTNVGTSTSNFLHNCFFEVVSDKTSISSIELLSNNRQSYFYPGLLKDLKIYVNNVDKTPVLVHDESYAKVTFNALTLTAGDKVEVVWNAIRFAKDLAYPRPAFISIK